APTSLWTRRQPPTSNLFPYTTLFRSRIHRRDNGDFASAEKSHPPAEDSRFCDGSGKRKPRRAGASMSRGCEKLLRRRLVHLQDVVPVDEAVDERLEVLWTGVAVIDVVGVLPDVDAEDRRRAMDQRVLTVRGLRDLELAVLDRQPCPARTELGRTSIDEVGAELVVAAEVAVDCLLQRARQAGAAAALLHPLPEVDVVVVLGSVVEEALVLAVGLLHNFLDRQAV